MQHDYQELEDLLESMKAKCEVSLFLLRCGKDKWLPSILECIHEDSQRIIFGWCIKHEVIAGIDHT